MDRALVLAGDSYSNANLYYKTRFLAGDPIVYIETEEETVLLVGSFEGNRARQESTVGIVKTFQDFGFDEYLAQTGDRDQALVGSLDQALRAYTVEAIVVEPDFPILYGAILSETGIDIAIGGRPVEEARRHKQSEEIDAIEASQLAAERAMQRVVDVLRTSEVLDDGLVFDGIPLTSERMRLEIDRVLLRENMDTAQEAIVAAGPGAAEPHWLGSGPLHPGEAIIVDIFPRSRSTRYYGDITRTFCKGQPVEPVQAMYDATLRAQRAALDRIKAGVHGTDIHEAVLEVYRQASFGEDGTGPTMIHGTGHGVGLDVHEAPRIGKASVELEVGDVITVEPGLYDPSIGGVRIEDAVAVTEDGYRNLTRFPKELVV